MLTIQIKNWQNNVVAVINDIFSMNVEDEVNKGGKIKIIFPTEKRLQEKPIYKGYRIVVYYGIKIGKTIKLFDGYITDVILDTTRVEIQAENRLSYLQNRMIRVSKNYSNKEIKTVISEVFTSINNNFQLPISLWLNDCDTKITRNFDKGTSLYDILKYCRESEKNLVVRILDWILEVSTNTGKVLEGVWEYDIRNSNWTNIVDWEWKDTIDDFYSFIQNKNWSINNQEFADEMGIIFEKYEWEGTLSLPTGKAIPSVVVSRDTDWWDFNVGDRKNIKLLTWYERLPLEYLGLIQSRKVVINASGGIKAEIKISEEYKSETNILDILISNLKKK